MAMLTTDSSCELFYKLSSQFSQLLYSRAEGHEAQINKILDEINSLDYRYPVVTNTTKAVLLVNQCCTLVPPSDSLLVSKCCKLITNLVNRQQVLVEGQTLTLSIQWCLQAAKCLDNSTVVEVLTALEALLRSNVQNSHSLLLMLTHSNSPIITLCKDKQRPQVAFAAVVCLETCTSVPITSKTTCRGSSIDVSSQLETCAEIFINFLVENPSDVFENALFCKMLISCLQGLQNVIVQHQEFLVKQLGLLLGISKTYMVYGINDIPFIKPEKVLPSILNTAEQSQSVTKEKKGGKVVKQRKHRATISNKKEPENSYLDEQTNRPTSQYVPLSANFDVSFDNLNSQSQLGGRLKTSDSEFSDSERGKMARFQIMEGKLRQAALNNLLHIIKLMDKHTIFCYWSSLVSEGVSRNVHYITTCILKDPSPKGRMAALNVLLALLMSSKLYLFQAESSARNTAFTPFSVILGSMLMNLHKCLSLALNENSIPVLTQVLKCLAALVQATPYHRLTPGIIRKIIRNAKIYIRHRDVSVQVGSLIVMGCILASEPSVPETKIVFLKKSNENESKSNIAQDNPDIKNNSLDNDIELVDFSSDDETDDCSRKEQNDMPWLLERCLFNLGVSVNDRQILEIIPSPVKLESLQVISAMTRNYFDCLLVPHLAYVTKSLDNCFSDKYVDLRLHAGRTVDFIGQTISQRLNSSDDNKSLIAEQGLMFWQTLLSKSIPSIAQCDEHAVLRAIGCDCLGSIGADIFECFPRNKQLLIITSLFACSRDEENSVKASAVRALAICVLYPSLKDDSGFVVDVAEAICRTLQDTNIAVRIKASWSLGNLSNVLVVNNSNEDVEKIPDVLLLRLIKISLQVANDNHKVKVNSLRALGNLLQLIDESLSQQEEFDELIQSAIEVLVKNSTTGTNMKVRWNSCYALGSVLKHFCLYSKSESRRTKMFGALIDLVMSFRNFKVRINAALALSCPINRESYGQHYAIIWDSLLTALENTQNVEDFNEYNHRDHLVDQICLTIGHITMKLQVEDLLNINDKLMYHFDLLKLNMHRVLERLLPEKSSTLLAAGTHLNNLLHHKLTSEQVTILQLLQSVFIINY